MLYHGFPELRINVFLPVAVPTGNGEADHVGQQEKRELLEIAHAEVVLFDPGLHLLFSSQKVVTSPRVDSATFSATTGVTLNVVLFA